MGPTRLDGPLHPERPGATGEHRLRADLPWHRRGWRSHDLAFLRSVLLAAAHKRAPARHVDSSEPPRSRWKLAVGACASALSTNDSVRITDRRLPRPLSILS